MNQVSPIYPPKSELYRMTARRSGALCQPAGLTRLKATYRQNVRRGEGETWVMVYLDVLTLLLATFVLLLAYLSRDPVDAEYPLNHPSPQIWKEVSEAVPGEILSDKPAEIARQYSAAADDAEESVDPGLARQLQDSLETFTNTDVTLEMEPGRINLHMPEKILFETGRADLIGGAHTLLDQIVPVLRETGQRISVEGHTDDIPISTSRFPSNWELSAARASTVIRYLIRNGIERGRLRAIGLADTQPVRENDSYEGRSANRRVTLVIHLNNQ